MATGSSPRTLPIPGFENTLTSDELLELGRPPSSVIFIGSGPIGMEFTHVFLRAGIHVTVLDAWIPSPEVLPGSMSPRGQEMNPVLQKRTS
ncbi:MAG: NAD(P)/FAD-dependent oxidoreductase [Bacteriovoracaceae bacterium]|nr:NAD(P)/FAD-dependent oxidoreductase [Deltaproteobacteria bacterium]NLW68484.1 NAD(P)/FAD-dependent oxidoreductase [Bacteriovoracaceae bacterium]